MKHIFLSCKKSLKAKLSRASLPSPMVISYLFLFLVMSVMAQNALAQAQVENAMSGIKSWIIIILNVAFLIGIAIGIFKAAMKFFRGDPDKVEYMIGVIIAIAIFGGFQFIVDDLATFLGGDIALDP